MNMNNFYPVKTEDGTISLYNTEINDIYHSKVGAYTESLQKFIIPSGILDYCRIHNDVKILDVCFGLGYNSKVAVSKIWEVNPDCKITITALEIDWCVLQYSTQANFTGMNEYCKAAFDQLIEANENKDTQDIKHVSFTEPASSILDYKPYKLSSTVSNDASIHNIYYRSISDSNKIIQNLQYKSRMLDIDIFLCDARYVIPALKPHYNYIFHDPFTPSKHPTLWTVDIFKEFYRQLDNSGNMTTYSSAAAVRGGLLEAGFYTGKTAPVGRKSSGTIAYKSDKLLVHPFSTEEAEYIKTTAGIPYYDSEFKFDIDDIINFRKKIQTNSGRLSSSQYLKQSKYNNTKRRPN